MAKAKTVTAPAPVEATPPSDNPIGNGALPNTDDEAAAGAEAVSKAAQRLAAEQAAGAEAASKNAQSQPGVAAPPAPAPVAPLPEPLPPELTVDTQPITVE